MANPDERNNTRKYLKYVVRAATAAEKPRAKSGRMFRRNAATVRTEPDSPHRTAGRRGIGSFAPIGPLPGRMSSRLAVALRACVRTEPEKTSPDDTPFHRQPHARNRCPSDRLQQVIPGTRIAANHSSEPTLTDPSGTGKSLPPVQAPRRTHRNGTVATRRPCTAPGPSSPIPSAPTAPAASAASRPFRPGRHKKSPNLSPGSFRLRCFELFIRGRPLFAVQIPHQPASEIPRDYNLLVRSFTSSPSNRCSTRWA